MQIKQMTVPLLGSLKEAFGEQRVLETLGTKDASTLDLQGVVDCGVSLLGSLTGDDLQAFNNKIYKGLLVRIFKIVIDSKRYSSVEKNTMYHDVAEYGAGTEVVYFEPQNPQDNGSWEIENGKTYDPFKVSITETKVQIFTKRGTWEVQYTLPNSAMMKTAFTSSAEMATFIEGIVTNAENSLEIQAEQTENFVVSHFIAKKLEYAKTENAKGIQVINLLTEYNANTGKTLTPEKAIEDADFLTYAIHRIDVISGMFNNMSKLFNTKQYARFTSNDDKRLRIISEFASSIRHFVYPDKYNVSFLSLPTTVERSYWQGIGESASFKEKSSVNITVDDGATVQCENVVALLSDHKALGITLWNKRVTSQVNGGFEYTNYWMKTDMSLFNDLSKNAVVFTLSDPVIIPKTSEIVP